MNGPLHGVRVLDLSAVISGPLATQVLADQGADVIKVEPPGTGDITRQLGKLHQGVAALFLAANRNKRSVVLDLSRPEGIEVLLEIARCVDVVVQNFRPGAVERMGVDYEAVRAVNPEVIYASVYGFGQDGPESSKRVYDPLIQAAAGYCDTQRGLGTEARIMRTLVCDKSTALMAAQGITAALYARQRGAGGQHLRLSMLDAGVAFLWPDAMWNHTLVDDPSPPLPNLGEIYRITRLVDGEMVILSVSEKEFAGICRAYGREDMLTDERFVTLAARMKNAMALVETLDAEAAKWRVADLAPRLVAEEVPFSVVNTRANLHEAPQIVHNATLVETEHPAAGRIRLPRHPLRFGGTPAVHRHDAPGLGEHTDAVLTEAGFTPAAITGLREAGVAH
ncbi:MAG: CoA transferase [Gammaproteobacteria bacterium]|nr:CoA transferase [Gammaproteobacteria bacterium]TVQ50041.1 MAG: CoA transferase [Gammaproteobacteria bacterium]